MNPFRLIFGLLLVYFCVFGLPEGCLVMPSHAVAPTPPSCTTESRDKPVRTRIPKPLLQDPSPALHSQAVRSLP